MKINITDFFYTGQAHLYSASAAELGENAGKITWANALKASGTYKLLDTLEKRSAFREFLVDTGGWTPSEALSVTLPELDALFIQFVAEDIREAGIDVPFPDWELYEDKCSIGFYSGRIFKSQAGQVYYDIGN